MSEPKIKARYSKQKRTLFFRITGHDIEPVTLRISPLPEYVGNQVARKIATAKRPDLTLLAVVLSPLITSGNRLYDCSCLPKMKSPDEADKTPEPSIEFSSGDSDHYH
ncbi:MAG: hypothetical protein GY757_28455 [bacterium]|nr:hypothetical protein [bacterium]